MPEGMKEQIIGVLANLSFSSPPLLGDSDFSNLMQSMKEIYAGADTYIPSANAQGVNANAQRVTSQSRQWPTT